MTQTSTADSKGRPLGLAYWDMLRSILWTLGSRWGLRSIGIVSTMIMARLLTPSDFGIVAMATMVGGLLDNLSRIGVQMLVIRERDTSREFYHTAWTMQLIQGFFVGALLVGLAPAAASYFDEPRVVKVMQVLAFSAALGGTASIGMVLFRKELKFSKDFQFQIAKRLVQFVATISSALVLRSYWSIVIGGLVAQVAGTALSFWMHPYRPRFRFTRAREFLEFAKSVIPYNLGFFFSGRADVFVVGHFTGTASLGVYNVSSELSGTFTREVVGTIGRGLFPNYANLASDRDRLNEAFLTVLAVTVSLATALGLGLVAVAPEFVSVLLGDQWTAAVPVLRWLAIYGTIVCLLEIGSGHILIVVGRERLSAMLMWCRLVTLVPMTIVAASRGDSELIAAAATASAAVVFPFAGYALSRSLGLGVLPLLSAIWRPIVASLAMLATVSRVPGWSDAALVMLVVKTLIGSAVYLVTLIGLWVVVGRPGGPERLVSDYLWTKWQRARKVNTEKGK